MGVTKESFGVTCKGDKVTLYKITNANGLVAEVIDFGAILKALYVPDKNGENADIVLGYNSITPQNSLSMGKNISWFLTIMIITTCTAILIPASTKRCGQQRS